MSDSTGPVRRRRIAGESAAPAPAAKKAPAPKVPTKKPAAKKAPAVRTAPESTAPSARTVPTVRAKTAPVVAKPVRPAPSARPESASDAGRGRPSRTDLRWLVPAVLVTLAVVVLGVLLGVRGLSESRDDGSAVTTAQRQATSAAATAAETIFTYRYDQLDDYVKDSQALMTTKFGTEFAKIEPAISQIAPQNKVQVKAVTRDAAAIDCGSECSTSKVDVLVFLDQVRLVGDSDQTTVFPNRIQVSMVKRDGGWLVDDIATLSNSPSLPGESDQGDGKAN